MKIQNLKRYQYLTFINLWANSSDDKFIFFLIFPRKQDLTFHANCLQSCFLVKIRKIFQYVMSSAEHFTQS